MKSGPSQTSIQEILTAVPPAFSDEAAIAIAAEEYGLSGYVQPLVSDRDQNFRLKARDGRCYTLKISNYAEQRAVVDFQNQGMLHVSERDASFPMPRVIPAANGQLHCSVEQDGKSHFVRVLSWLEGRVIHDTTLDPGLAWRLGQLLARLDRAFRGFDHPGSNAPSLWDMKRAAGLADLVVHIEEPALRQLIAKTLEKFISEVMPVLGTLRAQVIHNDLNPGNVLMDIVQMEKIAGVIDFGDMTRSPLIIDLAVAAAYQLSEGNDPLAGALPMIAGYHSTLPLLDKEMALLIDLIRTRLITSILIGSYRSILFPENREYLLISQRAVRNALINLNHLEGGEAFSRIRGACHE